MLVFVHKNRLKIDDNNSPQLLWFRMKRNEWGFRPPLCTFRLNWARMVRWMRWHCPPNTRFKIRALAAWGRARYLSVTEVPHNIESLRVSGEETFCFFETWRPEWELNPRSPTFQAGSFNHSTKPPTLVNPDIGPKVKGPSEHETLTL